MTELRPADELFLMHYISNGFNMAAAYRACHPRASNATAARESSRKMKSKEIRCRLKELVQEQMSMERCNLSVQILELLKRRMFYDPLDIVDESGRIRPDINRNMTIGIIDSLDHQNTDGQMPPRIKFPSRDKAIELTLRLLALSAGQENEEQTSARVILLPQSMAPDAWMETYGPKASEYASSGGTDRAKTV